jgi:hypothetical protein
MSCPTRLNYYYSDNSVTPGRDVVYNFIKQIKTRQLDQALGQTIYIRVNSFILKLILFPTECRFHGV